jgi:hypothetical protein
MVKSSVSGGQTGADRAALDFALENNFAVKGYCPAGRRANDGPLDEKYPLLETKSSAYPPRTRLNVKIAQATIIFNGLSEFSSGTNTTIHYARMYKKKYAVLQHFPDVEKDVSALKEWLKKIQPESLNIAGNGEEKCPGIYEHVLKVLRESMLLCHGDQ